MAIQTSKANVLMRQKKWKKHKINNLSFLSPSLSLAFYVSCMMTAIETCEMKLEEGRPEWSMGWVCERAILSNLISKVAGKRKKNCIQEWIEAARVVGRVSTIAESSFWKMKVGDHMQQQQPTTSSKQSIESRSRLAWQNTACCWLPWISRELSRSKSFSDDRGAAEGKRENRLCISTRSLTTDLRLVVRRRSSGNCSIPSQRYQSGEINSSEMIMIMIICCDLCVSANERERKRFSSLTTVFLLYFIAKLPRYLNCSPLTRAI